MSNQNIEFKDSQIAWIGQIPKHWEITKNKYILNGVYSGGTPTSGTPEFYTDEDNGIPFVSIGDMSKKEFIESTKTKVTKLGIRDKNLKILTKNTILYSIYATIGKVAELKCNATISQALLALFVKNSYDKQFYKYNLKAMKDYIFFQSNGNTQFNLNANKVINFHFLLPPLNEQEKIANFLDNKCEKIDNTIKNLEQKISNLKEYKKSLISECVTKGLNPKNMEFKDSQIAWIGQIPKHWEISKIKYHGTARNGLTYSPSDLTDESGILVLRSSNVQDSKLVFNDNVYVSCSVKNNLMVKNNDILICSRNGSRNLIGKNALIDRDVKATFGAFMLIYRSKISKFMFYVLNSNIFSYHLSNFVTSTINQLTNSNFENIKFPLPPLNEQKEIAEFLDKKCEKIDRLNENYTKQITTLKEYKKSLIYECVTGKKEI